MNRSTTMKIVSIDKDRITGICMEGDGEDNGKMINKIVDIDMNRDIYLALLIEMKKADVIVDEELQCFNNRIFTFFEREWKGDQVFGAALRKDLEYLEKGM